MTAAPCPESNERLEAAIEYARLGYRVVPVCWPGPDHRCGCGQGHFKSPEEDGTGKVPLLGKGWEFQATTDAELIRGWWTQWPDANVGIMLPEGTIGIDADHRPPGKTGPEDLAYLQEEHDDLPPGPQFKTGGGGRRLFFRLSEGVRREDLRASPKYPGLELTKGGHCVLSPSLHKSGRSYEELSPLVAPADLPEMPLWLVQIFHRLPAPPDPTVDSPAVEDRVQRLLKSSRGRALADLWTSTWPDRSARDNAIAKELGRHAFTRDEIQATLKLVPGGKAAQRSGAGDGYVDGTVEAALSAVAAEATGQPGLNEAGSAEASREFKLTDLGNAERLVHRHGEVIRYVHSWKKWICWAGTHWAPDQTGEVVRLATETVRSIYEEAHRAQDSDRRRDLAAHAARSENELRLRGMIKLAEADARVAITHEGLDRDRYLLSVLNGTLDLRTGRLLPHRHEDFITRCVNITFEPAAHCPRWQGFLDTIFSRDADLIAFVQRAIGYTLTGSTGEQCFFLCHGQGANGKSTLLEILRRLLGPLAANTDFTTFLQGKRGDGPRTDIARLAGARLVTAVEAESGQKLSTVLIKQLTGGDTVTARKLYAEEIEFQMQAKIWMAGNHRPRVTESDLATWRRVKMISFNATIANPVKDFHEVLAAELPGILNWALAGCLAQQAHGLGSCAAVDAATAEYQQEQDDFGRFLEECCTILPAAKVCPSALHAKYLEWAAENGEPALSSKALWSKLQERQEFRIKQDRVKSGRLWVGIGLKFPIRPGRGDAGDADDGVSVTLQ